MHRQGLPNALRFYFITDDSSFACPPVKQVRIALQAGATMIQYRNKSYNDDFLPEILFIRELCEEKRVPFLVNDHLQLAQRISADGVHLGQDDASPAAARRILGREAIIGISVSTPSELRATDLTPCDYLGTGPVFPTGTKADAKAVKGLSGLKEIVDLSPLPVVAIGGITAENAPACFKHGAAGVAVISFISRAADPLADALRLARACGVRNSR